MSAASCRNTKRRVSTLCLWMGQRGGSIRAYVAEREWLYYTIVDTTGCGGTSYAAPTPETRQSWPISGDPTKNNISLHLTAMRKSLTTPKDIWMRQLFVTAWKYCVMMQLYRQFGIQNISITALAVR
jgi:hypothetical protein